jgi:hypothetical protein
MTTPAAALPDAPLLDQRAPGPLLSRNPRLALATFVAIEALAFGFYLWFGRHQWFFLDEWDFLAGRDPARMSDLLRPHVVHWTTVPFVIYRAMWSLFGANSYLPYQALSVANHLVVAALLRVVIRRAGVGPWIATTAAATFVLFGAGNHNILWAFQIAFTLSLTFGLLHLLLADHRGPIDRRDWLGLGAGLAAIMSSGVGPPMVVAVGLAVLLRRGWRSAVFHTLPLGLIYGAWWLRYGRHVDDALGRSSLRETTRFVASGYRGTFDALGGVSRVGFALVAILAVGLASAWRHLGRRDVRGRAAAPAGLLLAGLVFLVITGWGRGGGALAAYERSSRYLYVVAALVLPALAVAIEALYQRWHWLGPLLLASLLVGIPHNVALTVDYPRGLAPAGPVTPAIEQAVLGRDIEPLLLALPRLPLAETAPPDLQPYPNTLPTITLGWLRIAAAEGKLPEPGTIGEETRALGELMLSIVQTDRPGPTTACARITKSQPRRLDKGDVLFIAGGVLLVAPTSAPGVARGTNSVGFDPARGVRLAVVAGPLDVVITSESVPNPTVVCERA